MLILGVGMRIWRGEAGSRLTRARQLVSKLLFSFQLPFHFLEMDHKIRANRSMLMLIFRI
jgi:hypothetical protein